MRKNLWWSDSVETNSLRCIQKNLGWLPKHAELACDNRGYITAEWLNIEATFLPTGCVSYMVVRSGGVRYGVAEDVRGAS